MKHRPLLVCVAASLVCAAALVGVARDAAASDGPAIVVLLERPGVATSLREALRIQLPRRVVVDVAALDPDGSTAARIRHGRELLVRRGGLVALWIEQDEVIDGDHEVTVYFVGRRGDRALVEVLRVRAGGREEIERAAAVKAVEVVEALQSAREPNVIAPFASAAPPSAAPQRARAEPSPYRVALASEVGAAFAAPSASAQAQAAAHVALGGALAGEAWRFEALVLARVPTPLSRSDRAGALSATEIDLFATVRGLWRRHDFALGGFTSAGARLISVEGNTAQGTPGRSDRAVPMLAFGPDVRAMLAPWLGVRLAAGAEIALVRQRFALNSEPVLDLGPGRGFVETALTAVVP
jgi:hypothetical protein